MPEVSSIWLTKGVLDRSHPQHLRRIVQPAGGLCCSKCNKELFFKTREELHTAIKGEQFNLKCGRCYELDWQGNHAVQTAELAERRAAQEREILAKQTTIKRLRSMPYEEYLRTPE